MSHHKCIYPATSTCIWIDWQNLYTFRLQKFVFVTSWLELCFSYNLYLYMLTVESLSNKGVTMLWQRLYGSYIYIMCVLVKVLRTTTNRASQHILRWLIGGALLKGGLSEYNTEAWMWTRVGNVFWECHVSCMLKTSFMNFEKGYAYCSL
jgi:hypothetical protein